MALTDQIAVLKEALEAVLDLGSPSIGEGPTIAARALDEVFPLGNGFERASGKRIAFLRKGEYFPHGGDGP